MSDLTDALERIRVFWEMNNPFVASLLEPGLSTQEINAKVEALSFCLPQEVYELYQWRNGISMNRAREYLQHIPSWCTFIEHFDFLPLEQAVDECRYLQQVKQEWIGDDPESYKEGQHLANDRGLFIQDWFPILGSDDLEYLFVLGSPNQKDNSPLFHCHLGGGSTPDKERYRSLTHFFQVMAECFEMGAYSTKTYQFGEILLERDSRKIALAEQKYSASNLDQCLKQLQQKPMTLDILVDIYEKIRKYKDSRVVEPLIRLLNLPLSEVRNYEENIAIRHRAASLLGEVGSLNAVDALIKIIENQVAHADNCTVVGYAAEALGELGDTRAIEPLKRLIASFQVNDPTESLNEIASEFRSDVMMGSVTQFYSQVFDTIFSSFPTDAAWEEYFALEQAKLALTLLEGNIH